MPHVATVSSLQLHQMAHFFLGNCHFEARNPITIQDRSWVFGYHLQTIKTKLSVQLWSQKSTISKPSSLRHPAIWKTTPVWRSWSMGVFVPRIAPPMFLWTRFAEIPCSAPPDGEGIPKDKAVGDLANPTVAVQIEDASQNPNQCWGMKINPGHEKKDDLN